MVNMIYGFMDTPRKPRCIYHSGGISYFWGQNRKASAHNVSLAAHFFWLPWSGASWVHTTGSKHYQRIHLEVIYHLCDVVRCKQLNLWTMVSWQLIHDNTLANFSPVIHSFLSKHNIHLVRQSPSSLKMVASDLCCSPGWKCCWKWSWLVVRRQYEKCDGSAALHSKSGLPEMLPTMTGPLWEVCAVPRRVYWRGVGFQTSKWVIVFFLPKVQSSNRFLTDLVNA